MMAGYTDQSASGLIFYLTLEDVDVHALTVLKSVEVTWNSCTISAGILGASHYLRVSEDGKEPLLEVFACAKLKLERPHIMSGPLDGLQTDIRSRIGSYTYTFKPRRLVWSEGEAELKQLNLAVSTAKAVPDRFGLSFEFPSDAKYGDRKPVTLILGDYSSSRFVFKTVHCYPNDDALVFTETTLIR